MASSLSTKLRIAASVLFATGFWDAVAGRFLWQPGAAAHAADTEDPPALRSFNDLRGALHVHSTYSDGAGDVPTIMAQARAAGVDFVLLSDHNTQRPLRDGWEERYAHDTPFLLIGTEITLEHGAFLLALGLPPAWEPTKDLPPQTAINQVNAAGGLPLVSLPFDVKHPWRDWDAQGYAGLEVLNLSTIARRHINLLSLAWLLFLFRRGGALAALRALATRPDQALARWDALLRTGTAIGIGALDAHALMKIGKKKHPLPSYADSFRAAGTHVLARRGDNRRGAASEALRAGRCYFSYDCLGDPSGFSFTAAPAGGSGGEEGVMGERAGRGARLVVRVPPASAPLLVRLFCDGRIVASGRGNCFSFTADLPGAYRVEVFRWGARWGALHAGARPWIFSNPIYVD